MSQLTVLAMRMDFSNPISNKSFRCAGWEIYPVKTICGLCPKCNSVFVYVQSISNCQLQSSTLMCTCTFMHLYSAL